MYISIITIQIFINIARLFWFWLHFHLQNIENTKITNTFSKTTSFFGVFFIIS